MSGKQLLEVFASVFPFFRFLNADSLRFTLYVIQPLFIVQKILIIGLFERSVMNA